MSAIDLALRGALSRNTMTTAGALGVATLDSAVGFGASVALGEVYARYNDKWYGKYAPELLAGVGKLAETVALFTAGPGFVSGVSGALANTGLNAIGLELGLNHARKDLGLAVVKVPTGTDVKKLKAGDAVPASTAVGGLPPADRGHGLAWDHVNELRQMR